MWVRCVIYETNNPKPIPYKWNFMWNIVLLSKNVLQFYYISVTVILSYHYRIIINNEVSLLELNQFNRIQESVG